METAHETNGTNQLNRIHSLDAYRGVLMILGIVLHGAIPFLHGGDDVSTGFVKFSFWSVHLFRMPAFFVLSGFFGALLWQRYGAGGMLMNRFERLALPLVASLTIALFVIFYPVLIAERWFNHSDDIAADAWDATLREIIPLSDPGHLWFLYYLVVITFVVAWWVRTQEKRSNNWSKLKIWTRQAFEQPWRFVVIFAAIHVTIILCALVAEPVGRIGVPVDGSWNLKPLKLCYYTLFYGLGWILFSSKTDLSKSKDSAWFLVCVGFVCVLIHTLCIDAYNGASFNINKPNPEHLLAFVLLLINWSIALFALSRGLMGLFYRYAANLSYWWRYVSDASYWIYLIHLVFALHLKDFTKIFGLPHVLDFGLTILMTSIIGFVSYDLFVRSTFIGRFLNGRRYQRFGWRLSAPGLGLIVVFFGCNVVMGLPYMETERRWIERGESLSQIPFDLKDAYADTMVIEGHEQCKVLGRYAFCDMNANFNDAQKHCMMMGAHLPVFKNKADNEGVANAAEGMKISGGWLGITDAKTEGKWVDHAGIPLSFTNWKGAEPNDYGGREDCAIFYGSGDWNDVECTHERHFICQFEALKANDDIELCGDLKDRVDHWKLKYPESSKTSPLIKSLSAQCDHTWSASTSLSELGTPIAPLAGVWVPDLQRIWQEPNFEHMAGHHRRWARGYGQIVQFELVFGTKEIGLKYRRKDEDERMVIPYSIQSQNGRKIVLKTDTGQEERTYTLTLEEKGIRVASESIIWALKKDTSQQ